MATRIATLTNLLPDPSAWSLSNVNIVQFEGYGNVFQLLTGGLAMATCSVPAPTVGHKYYGRCMYMTDAGGFSCADGRFEYYHSDAPNDLMVFQTAVGNDTAGSVITESSIQSISESVSSDATWTFRNFVANGTQAVYRAYPMLIDLTSTFGAGNEPDQAWCDTNISNFYGSTTIAIEWTPTGGPNSYYAVEYIESTGLEYIDTEYYPNQDTKVVMDVQPIGEGSDAKPAFFGAMGSSYRFYAYWSSGQGYYYNYNQTNGYKKNTTMLTNRMTVTADKNMLYIGDAITLSATYGTFTCNQKLYLFAVNYRGVAQYWGVNRVYSCKIYHYGVLVRNFVPCINSAGEAGLYDKINNKFYTNAGRGAFTTGGLTGEVLPNARPGTYIGIANTKTSKVPSGYQEVEYIQSTGTEYIDTNFKPNQNTRIVASMQLDSSMYTMTLAKGILGTRDNTTTNAFVLYLMKNGSSASRYGFIYRTSQTTSLSEWRSDHIVIDINKNVFSINDKAIHTVSDSTAFACSYNAYLFNFNDKGSAYSEGGIVAKLYSCQIYDDGVLVRDFVPCIDPNSVVGLYDAVNNQFYGNAGTGEFTAGTVVTIHPYVAKKIYKGYVGVNTEFKTYETQTQDYSVTTEDILLQLFEPTDNYSNCTFTNSQLRMTGSKTVSLIAKNDMELSFSASVGSSQGSTTAKLEVRKYAGGDGTSSATLLSISGNLTTGTGQCESVFVPKGAYLNITSSQAGTNKAIISDIAVTTHTNVLVSTTYKEVARKIRKAYIGVNGIARLCWSNGIMDRTGSAKLRRAKNRMAECSNDTHAFFSGGYVSYDDGTYSSFTDTDIYDSSFVLTQAPTRTGQGYHYGTSEVIGDTVYMFGSQYKLKTDTFTSTLDTNVTGRMVGASCKNSTHAFFAGGVSGSYAYNYATAINPTDGATTLSTLSKSKVLLAAATVGGTAIFAGGSDNSVTHYATADGYNSSLTKVSVPSLSEAKAELAATETASHALFAGGWISLKEGYTDTVEAYDTSLTKTTLAPLSRKVCVLSATSAKGCAIFAGGSGGLGEAGVDAEPSDCVDIYDASLTKHIGESLSSPRWYLSATAIGDKVLIAGGLGTDNFTGVTDYTDVIDVYTLNI